MSKHDRTTWIAMGYLWIVYTDSKGRVCTCGPHDADVSKPDAVNRFVPPGATNISWVTFDKIPQERYWRNAWERDGQGGIAVNLDRAREIHAENLSLSIDAAIKKLNTDLLMAKVKSNAAEIAMIQTKLDTINADMEALDLTKAKNLDELKALWIEGVDK